MKIFARCTGILLVFGGSSAVAQKLEAGARAGGGVFSVSSGGSSGAAQLGAEACLFCSGRLGLFGEYAHWISAEGRSTTERIRSADLAGAGLRMQWSRSVRPFFDVGLVGGRDRHNAGGGGALGGVVVGSGVSMPVGGRWYVRPQLRAYGLSPHTLEGAGPHWAVAAGLGFGWRF